MELDVLNAVEGGEDDHSLLRYHVGFVDITRTMTPMVSLLPIECNRNTLGLTFSLCFAESPLWKRWALDGWEERAGTQFLC